MAGNDIVTYKPFNPAEFAAGLGITATGITNTSVGYVNGNPIQEASGLATALVGLYLIRDSLPQINVSVPVQSYNDNQDNNYTGSNNYYGDITGITETITTSNSDTENNTYSNYC